MAEPEQVYIEGQCQNDVYTTDQGATIARHLRSYCAANDLTIVGYPDLPPPNAMHHSEVIDGVRIVASFIPFPTDDNRPYMGLRADVLIERPPTA